MFGMHAGVITMAENRQQAIMQVTLKLSKLAKSMHKQINAYSDDVSMLIVSSQDQDLSQSPIQVKNTSYSQ